MKALEREIQNDYAFSVPVRTEAEVWGDEGAIEMNFGLYSAVFSIPCGSYVDCFIDNKIVCKQTTETIW